MRCKYCGSKMLYPNKRHQVFNTGMAVAGAVAFGVVGAAAGFIGRDHHGYSCSACGAFDQEAMAFPLENGINLAVKKASEHHDFHEYDVFKQQYPNIEEVHRPGELKPTVAAGIVDVSYHLPEAGPENVRNIKNSYYGDTFVVGAPVHIRCIQIIETADGDKLAMEVSNCSGKTLRAVYFRVTVLDDVGDLASECQCVYQRLKTAAGELLPLDKEFSLNTEVAYKVKVVCEKAAFEDDSVWRKGDTSKTFPLREQMMILPQTFPQYRFLRSMLAEKSRIQPEQPVYEPVFSEEYRQCICGNPVMKNCACGACGLDEETLLSTVDYGTLVQYRKDLIQTNARRRADETEAYLLRAKKAKHAQAVNRQKEGTKAGLEAALELFAEIPNFEDVPQCMETCREQLEVLRKDSLYSTAMGLKNAGKMDTYKSAIEIFLEIAGWKDADKQLEACKQMIAQLEAKAEAERLEQERLAEEERQRMAENKAYNKKLSVKILAISGAAVAAIVSVALLITWIIPQCMYNAAEKKLAAEEFDQAYTAFEKLDGYLGGYRDAAQKMHYVQYVKAEKKFADRNYDEAIELFTKLGSYEDSAERIQEVTYAKAEQCFADKNYDEAIVLFGGLRYYEDSPERVKEAMYAKAEQLFAAKDYSTAQKYFAHLDDYKDAKDRFFEIRYIEAGVMMENGDYDQAIKVYIYLGSYKDSKEQKEQATYKSAERSVQESDYDSAAVMLENLPEDSAYAKEADQLYTKIMDYYYSQKLYEKALDVYAKTADYSETSDTYKDLIYQLAKDCYDKKEYTWAAIYFGKIPKYLDADQLKQESQYQYADLMLRKGVYSDAVMRFEQLGDYKDSKTKALEAKYQYVLRHRTANDAETYSFLKTLKAAKYKDSEKIFDDLYRWKFEIAVNDSEYSWTNQSSLSVYDDWYFHIKLTGGEPDASINLRYRIICPDGSVREDQWERTWSAGWSGWCACTNYYSSQTGTCTLELYEVGGKLLETRSVNITN